MNKHILEKARNYDTVILYGLGRYGRRCFFDLKEYDGRILCAISESAENQRFYDIEVMDLASYVPLNPDALVIVAVSDQYRDEMRKFAFDLGFKNVYTPEILLNDPAYIADSDDLDLRKEISEWYEVFVGQPIDIEHPKTYNEKIQWLKLYDSTYEKTELADKYLVRDYVGDKLGEKYLIPIYGVWSEFNQIDFSNLPEKFVLKCTHASGTNEIVTSKSSLDFGNMQKVFDGWLSQNYAYVSGFEMHYKGIQPRIIAEKYLETDDGVELRDYKVHVFNGHAKLIQVDIDRSKVHRRNLYTTRWEYIPYSILYPTAPDVKIECPECLNELIDLAEKLAEGFIYVRCDFYILGNRIYFGEMTFTHGSGVEPFDPEEFNLEMGKWIHLPIDKE